MPPQSATSTYTFATSTALALEATFDGGRLTSDGGLPWLAEAEEELGICAAFATCVPEWRRGPVRHSLVALVRQRVFQIACGYEDQNDADTPRGRVARRDDRDALRQRLCRARALRLVRAGAHRLHHRPDPQQALGGGRGAPARPGPGAARAERADGALGGRDALSGRLLGPPAPRRLQG